MQTLVWEGSVLSFWCQQLAEHLDIQEKTDNPIEMGLYPRDVRWGAENQDNSTRGPWHDPEA
jgi:hypothetical protein